MKLKRAVKSAMIYPIAVLGIWHRWRRVIILLLWKVVPIFTTLFNGLGVDLPLPTRIVIALSSFIGSIYGLMILVFFVGIVFALKFWYGTPQGRYAIDATIMLKLPMSRNAAAQDCRCPFHADPRHSDLQRRAHTGRTRYYSAYFWKRGGRGKPSAQLRKAVEAGRSLVDPLKETNVFPGMVTQMIGVGEQTGAMDAMLQKIADFYEDEVDAAVKDLLTAMEPIMIVVLGVVVGGIVISMYLPLFSLIGKLSSH